MTSVLLVRTKKAYVAHLLEHDLVGQGRTAARALFNLFCAYQVAEREGMLATLEAAPLHVWAEFREGNEITFEEALRLDEAQDNEFSGAPPPWMIHTLLMERQGSTRQRV